MQMASATKQIKYNYLLKYTSVCHNNTRDKTQSHKTPNIPYFTPIRTYHTHQQGGELLTYSYIKNSINFSQLSTSNTFSIKLQVNKIHHSTSQQLHIANMCIPLNYPELQIIKIHLFISPSTYRKHVHSTLLSQIEENSVISSTLQP